MLSWNRSAKRWGGSWRLAKAQWNHCYQRGGLCNGTASVRYLFIHASSHIRALNSLHDFCTLSVFSHSYVSFQWRGRVFGVFLPFTRGNARGVWHRHARCHGYVFLPAVWELRNYSEYVMTRGCDSKKLRTFTNSYLYFSHPIRLAYSDAEEAQSSPGAHAQGNE